jgi:S-DNA-T family DNA segregation ATPase FtsK/SpoIIIE
MTNDVWKVTVSDLHLCQRCPRLLGYLRQGERHAWRVGIAGSKQHYGKLFHQHIAGKFHADAAMEGTPLREKLAEALRVGRADLKARLDAIIRERYFVPFLSAHGTEYTSDQLMGAAKATAFWVECLAGFLSGIPSLRAGPEKEMNRVFQPPEKTLRVPYPYSDGHTMRVSGRYDALLFNPEAKEAVLFEFKGFESSDVAVELSQVLLYAWLVSAATGIVPAVKVIYLEDDRPLDVSATNVKKMLGRLPRLFDAGRQVFERRLPLPGPSDPALCETCPFRARCDGDWGERGGERKYAEKSTENLMENLMEKLLENLRQLRVYVTSGGYVCGPGFIRLKIKPDIEKGTKTTIRRIESTAKDLQVALTLVSPPLIAAQDGYVSIDVPRKDRQTLTLTDLLRRASSRPESDAAFPLGLDISGEVFWVDLTDPLMTGILVGGTSGSGKSVLLRSIVVGLLLLSPGGAGCCNVSFTLIDPKRVTFTDMKTLRCLEEGTVLYDTDAAMEALQNAADEMERRYVLMEEAETPDIAAYNAKSPDKLKRRVILIDEYADMIVSPQTRAPLELFVQRICQKGRAAGIHLILATQRPDARVVTGVIKANLQLRVALKVTSGANSQIILGEGYGQAQYLLGHGDMLVGGSVALQRLQAPLASADMLGAEYFVNVQTSHTALS